LLLWAAVVRVESAPWGRISCPVFPVVPAGQRRGFARQAAVLPRQYGDEVVFVVKQNWRGQQVSLAQRGLSTTAVIPMTSLRGLFSRNEVRQAVLARGWRFKSGS